MTMLKFPSPCGDYGSYHSEIVKLFVMLFVISVPLRGLWFLSAQMIFYGDDFNPKFPSPCGDYGSYRYAVLLLGDSWNEISVPLRGLWFLSVEVKDVILDIVSISVPLRGLWFLSPCTRNVSLVAGIISVPLRGLWFLSRKSLIIVTLLYGDFRPLAGIMVLIKSRKTNSID